VDLIRSSDGSHSFLGMDTTSLIQTYS
jgi:hypothetical protein